ncbi:ROK family protein [Nocardia seriolae]|uniref:Glucokinase n=1 Tax=Nocardia seriolae TaxID=37332 RepID=A0ABC8B1M6_9NOCA|nr:ROK family protein [Nocardia seriolae]APA99972.1 Glucokinase [Nocardia seriolae]WKY54881.1 ROK family protein [Nocardia seriolae]WNJ56923.1 ROK family protein [Nocardia seriolae]BAW08228.1 conserved hypothetical protein [Nocardia seriolae]BEK89662.1 ROK family protein [Nocardia seriolae]
MTAGTLTRPQVAIDLGGTWLRLRIDGELVRMAAPSVLNRPGADPADLIVDLVETLCAAIPADAMVAMSCGAAMDEERGLVHGSGPLWGGALPEPVLLADLLRDRRPDVGWRVINDVTAGLASFTARFAEPGDRRIAYLTISSGIAMRVADLGERSVPVDAHGLQGEIGHLRAVTSMPEALRELRCDCDASGHISAISAGPALAPVIAALGITDESLPDRLAERVRAGDPTARLVLRAVVEPIAEVIRVVRCVDPRIDRFGLGGGYVEGLGAVYREELGRQLRAARSYADNGYGPGWFDEHVRVCLPGDIDTLDGAAAIARGALVVTKN